MEGEMKELGMGLLAAAVLCIGILAGQSQQAAATEAHRSMSAPLEITAYLGINCVLPDGSRVAEVVTDDDADLALQHCDRVTWKELRRE
jgi:hypothetical protein